MPMPIAFPSLLAFFATVFAFTVLFASPRAFSAEMSDVLMQVPAPYEEKIRNAAAPIIRSARIDDEGDVLQLLRRLRPAIRDAMGTEGFFDPKITRLQPELQDLKLRIAIEPGAVTTIASLDIQFTGAVADGSAESADRVAALKEAWLLKPGDVFKQSLWAQSKQRLLQQLSRQDFAAASLVDSEADIDPEEKTARLTVVYDSGPRFTMGPVQVEGLKKYRDDLVSRFVTIRPGDAYDQDTLLALQSALQNTAYFSSVSVDMETNPQTPLLVPIKISVTESQTQRIGVGAGASSNTGLRSEINYRDQNFLDKAYALSTGVRLEQRRSTVYADLILPPRLRSVVDSLGVSYDRLETQGLTTERLATGVIRQQTRGAIEVQYGVNYQQENRLVEGQPTSTSNALTASLAWKQRTVADVFNPADGYVLTLQAAVASKNVLSEQDFLRLYSRYQHYWSLGTDKQLTARAELGTVLSPSRQGIPEEFLIRSGGTNSVRGLPYLGLGLRDGAAVVGGRRMVTGSVEYTQWIKGPIGVAIFTDAGAVSDSWSELKVIPSIGFGPRYKTPAGPIAVDIASARGQRGPRLHFSLGVAF